MAVGLANQAVRFYHARRGSLGAFAAEVGSLLPRRCPLAASGGVSEGDRLVLAYLLDRDVLRSRGPAAPDGALLVPATGVEAIARDGFTLLAETGRSSGLALVRGPESTACGTLTTARER